MWFLLQTIKATLKACHLDKEKDTVHLAALLLKGVYKGPNI